MVYQRRVTLTLNWYTHVVHPRVHSQNLDVCEAKQIGTDIVGTKYVALDNKNTY